MAPVVTILLIGTADTKADELSFLRKEIEALERDYALEVDLDAKIENLPVGVQQRVEIIKLLYRNADILIFDDVIMDTPDLTVPHPRLAERPFVLAPLAEIAPGLVVPVHHQTVSELLKALGDISAQAWSRGPLAALDLDAEDAA